jgi:membrane associated rhomboid family serine protease
MQHASHSIREELYGSLLSGIMPWVGAHVSWDGHLCGAIAGGAVAYALTRESTVEAPP